jgi:hypothetical protein
MNIFEMQGFNVQIPTRSGIYDIWVWGSGEILELGVEEPSGKMTMYSYSGGKLISHDRAGDRAYYIESQRWIMEEPIPEVVSQEMQQVGAEAVAAYLVYERERQVAQG